MNMRRLMSIVTIVILALPVYVVVAPSPVSAEPVPVAPPSQVPVNWQGEAVRQILWFRNVYDQAGPSPSASGGSPTGCWADLSAYPPPIVSNPQAPSPPPVPDPTNPQGAVPGTSTANCDQQPHPRAMTFEPTTSSTMGSTPAALYQAKFVFDVLTTKTVEQGNSTGLRDALDVPYNGLTLKIMVEGQTGLQFQASLVEDQSQSSPIAKGSAWDNSTNPQSVREVDIPLVPTSGGTMHFQQGDKPAILIEGVAGATGSASTLGATATWTLVYDEQSTFGTRLEIQSSGSNGMYSGLKYAVWTANKVKTGTATVTTFFRNYSGLSNYSQITAANPYIHDVVGYFAVQSVFGLGDISSMLNASAPQAQILQGPSSGSPPINIRPWPASCDAQEPAISQIPMVPVPNSASDNSGTIVFRTPQKGEYPGVPQSCQALDVWELNHTVDSAGHRTTTPAAGQYTFRATADYTPTANSASSEQSVYSTFTISSVAPHLQPLSFMEDNNNSLTDSGAHQVAAAGTTTFLLDLSNGGAMNDTYAVDAVTQISSTGNTNDWVLSPLAQRVGDATQPSSGASDLWSLGAGNHSILALTVTAPHIVGASATFVVTAVSQTDPNEPASRVSVSLRADTFDPNSPPQLTSSNTPGLVLLHSSFNTTPGKPTKATVFAWNRGPLPTDMVVRVQRGGEQAANWNATMMVNNLPVEVVTLRSVPAGDMAAATVRASVLTNATALQFTPTITAALATGGSSTPTAKTLTFTKTVSSNILVSIMDKAVGIDHTLDFDTAGCTASNNAAAGSSSGCTAAGVDYTYYRIFITNQKAAGDTFHVSALIAENPPPTQGTGTQTTPVWNVTVGTRDITGLFTPDSGTGYYIDSGKTAAVWVKIYHDANPTARTALNPGAILYLRIQSSTDTLTPQYNIATEGGSSTSTSTGFVSTGTTVTRTLGAKLEPFSLLPSWTAKSPYVDITNLTNSGSSSSLNGYTGVGQPKYYNFTITDAAGYGYFTDSGTTYDSRPVVTLSGVQHDRGWTAYFRPHQSNALAYPQTCDASNFGSNSGWIPDIDANGNPTPLKWPPTQVGTTGPVAGQTYIPDPPGNLQVRANYFDYQLDVVVCPPPNTFQPRPLAGSYTEAFLQINQVGPGGLSSSDFKTIVTTIAGQPHITLIPRVPAGLEASTTGAGACNPHDTKDVGCIETGSQPGTIVYVPVYVVNDGSYLTNVTITAQRYGTTSGAGWGQQFTDFTIAPLRAFENRTVAIPIAVPATTPGTAPPYLDVQITASYPMNPYDPASVANPVTTSTYVEVDAVASTPPFTVSFDSAATPNCVVSNSQLMVCNATLQPDANGNLHAVAVQFNVVPTQNSVGTVHMETPDIPGWSFVQASGGATAFNYSTDLTMPSAQNQGVSAGFTVTPPRDATSASAVDVPVTFHVVGQYGEVRTVVVRFLLKGGIVLASIATPRTQQLVQRNNYVNYTVTLVNTGNQNLSSFRLQAQIVQIVRAQGYTDPRLCTVPQTPTCWEASIALPTGQVISDSSGAATIANVAHNQLVTVNLTIRAPLYEQPGAYALGTLNVYDANAPQTPLASLNVQSKIQDYGVYIQPVANSITIAPGLSGSVLVLLKNTGNGNDTLNVSVDTGGLPWSSVFQFDHIFLPAGATTGVRLTFQSPTDPLPTPRLAKMWIYGGSVGNHIVNQTCVTTGSRNCIADIYASSPFFIRIPQYRQADVDNDNITELAVAMDPTMTDGYDTFVVYSSLGVVPHLVDKALGADHHFKFLIEVPTQAGAYSNIANVYWDPDTNIVSRIVKTFDLNNDGTVDYLIASQGGGVVDTTYESATREFLRTYPVHILAPDKTQYLIDTVGDGAPHKYYDPDYPPRGLVTNLQPQPNLGPNVYGVDTVGDGKIHLFYDYKTQTVTPVQGVQIVDFAKNYWYVFAGFLAVVILFGVVLSRRRRGT
ncbi:MAG: hypothetical protein ACYDDF_03790 [Thermoplasmatota archaeon]